MASRRTHAAEGAFVGGFLGAAGGLIRARVEGRPVTLWDLVGGTLVGAGAGAVAGVLPDILEPASHPNHRRVFHSLELAIGLAPVVMKVVANERYGVAVLAVGVPAAAGYWLHLARDSETSRGLPRYLLPPLKTGARRR